MLVSRIGEIADHLDNEMDDVIRHLSDLVVDYAKMRVSVQTGRLKAEIHQRREGQAEYRVLAGNQHGAFYAHFVERGTDHNMEPQPFLEPALEQIDVAVEHIGRMEFMTL